MIVERMQSQTSLFCLNGYPWQLGACGYTIVRRSENELPIVNDIFDIIDMISVIVKRMHTSLSLYKWLS